MKLILPGLVLALPATFLATLPARSDRPKTRPLAQIQADLAAHDPYAPEAAFALDRLLAECARTRVARRAATR